MPIDDEDDDLEEALLDPEKITHPVFQDIPDEINEDWTHGVLIGGMATETSDITVAKAYWWAAETLIEPALRTREPELYVYPILFLIRHALELYLKAILQPPKLNHDLVPLIEQLDRLMERRFRQKPHVARRSTAARRPAGWRAPTRSRQNLGRTLRRWRLLILTGWASATRK